MRKLKAIWQIIISDMFAVVTHRQISDSESKCAIQTRWMSLEQVIRDTHSLLELRRAKEEIARKYSE